MITPGQAWDWHVFKSQGGPKRAMTIIAEGVKAFKKKGAK